MRVIVAILIACVGCTTTHRSSLPPYVRSLQPAREGGIEMISCGMILEITEKHGPFHANDADETELESDKCWRTVIPTAVQQ
jgi:hypothetical protein